MGFINKDGKEVIPYIFDSVFDFKEGFAHVKLNGEWVLIDYQGNVLLSKYYEEEIDTLSKEDQIQFKERVLNAKYKEFIYELEFDGTIVTFKTKEEREEYKRILTNNIDVKHYIKK